MGVAVVFDTSSYGWDQSDFERRMTAQVAAWKHDESDAHRLITDGHDKADDGDA